jgi:hypothetical protein
MEFVVTLRICALSIKTDDQVIYSILFEDGWQPAPQSRRLPAHRRQTRGPPVRQLQSTTRTTAEPLSVSHNLAVEDVDPCRLNPSRIRCDACSKMAISGTAQNKCACGRFTPSPARGLVVTALDAVPDADVRQSGVWASVDVIRPKRVLSLILLELIPCIWQHLRRLVGLNFRFCQPFALPYRVPGAKLRMFQHCSVAEEIAIRALTLTMRCPIRAH